MESEDARESSKEETLVAKIMGSKKTRQNKRWKRNNASTPVQNYEYEMIDGNWTARPHGYCHKYHGFLTRNMAIRHRCEKKHCPLFKTFEQYELCVNKNLPKFMTLEQYKEIQKKLKNK